MKIFIPVIGQFTNVGDVMHRKQLLKWLSNVGELHIYVGKAPQSFVSSLEISENSKVYTSLLPWLLAIITSGYKKTAFVFNPGEIRLVKRRMLGELALFPFQLIVRLKRGEVLRVGIAAMSNSNTGLLWLWKFLLKPTTQIYWRTYHSRDLFNRGVVIPDLAFYDGSAEAFNTDISERNYLTISMRQDRPAPTDKWFDVVKKFALANNFKIMLVSQVRMDNASCIEISRKLNGETFLWPEDRFHTEQEELLRDVYRKTRVILSDRLHVLIAAMSEGAIPATLLTAPSQKVQHHFSVLKMENVSMDVNTHTEDEILKFLQEQVGRYDETKRAIEHARIELEKTRKDVVNRINRS